ncbi:hypothetical protein KW805_00215 [Candidatus Pacearchaeota archaeon]|nr:hypothetical protein [Candidatus Pacearchaeota archaeon]
MIWQDMVIFACTVLFGYALIPQIYDGFRKKKGSVTLQTSLITALGMYVLAVCYLTLSFYLSFAIDIVLGSLWFILFLQRLYYG